MGLQRPYIHAFSAPSASVHVEGSPKYCTFVLDIDTHCLSTRTANFILASPITHSDPDYGIGSQFASDSNHSRLPPLSCFRSSSTLI